jgi:hypothetical protein
MSEQERKSYGALLDELTVIQKRLAEVADNAFADMEGADFDDFVISEELWFGLDIASGKVERVVERCRALLGPDQSLSQHQPK